VRGFYEPLDRKKRAAQYRKSAQECEKAGFLVFAEINRETAAFLDPWDPEREE
jgi:hypothetical protein